MVEKELHRLSREQIVQSDISDLYAGDDGNIYEKSAVVLYEEVVCLMTILSLFLLSVVWAICPLEIQMYLSIMEIHMYLSFVALNHI